MIKQNKIKEEQAMSEKDILKSCVERISDKVSDLAMKVGELRDLANTDGIKEDACRETTKLFHHTYVMSDMERVWNALDTATALLRIKGIENKKSDVEEVR